MLSIVGLGLCDGLDITLRGKLAVDNATRVYLEGYTSLLQCDHATLEQQLGKTVTILDRIAVEQQIEKVLQQAKTQDVVLLVIGDPFGATTHADLYLRAVSLGVKVQVIHNASIINAIGAVGLELYKYGRTVSIPYWTESFTPTSFLEGIQKNHERGLHTLCLLDIKADQERFMSVQEGLSQLRVAATMEKSDFINDDLLVVGVARIGCPDQKIVAGRLADVMSSDFGAPLHSIIIPGKLHPIEEEMLALWK